MIRVHNQWRKAQVTTGMSTIVIIILSVILAVIFLLIVLTALGVI
jgi:hypothetical protein